MSISVSDFLIYKEALSACGYTTLKTEEIEKLKQESAELRAELEIAKKLNEVGLATMRATATALEEAKRVAEYSYNQACGREKLAGEWLQKYGGL